MGRKTWSSLPKRFRPLPSRLNIVLSRSPEADVRKACDIPESVTVASSLDEALALAEKERRKPFVIGGGHLIAEALARSDVSTVWLTVVLDVFDKRGGKLAVPRADTFVKMPFGIPPEPLLSAQKRRLVGVRAESDSLITQADCVFFRMVPVEVEGKRLWVAKNVPMKQ